MDTGKHRFVILVNAIIYGYGIMHGTPQRPTDRPRQDAFNLQVSLESIDLNTGQSDPKKGHQIPVNQTQGGQTTTLRNTACTKLPTPTLHTITIHHAHVYH